ncbi:unnamed protein product, partial [Rotaria sp. Silwood2]
MFNEFYLKQTIEKESVHDAELEVYAIQKKQELNWDTFKAKDITKLLPERKQQEEFAVQM